MRVRFLSATVLLAPLTAVALGAASPGELSAPVTRTVYVTVTDGKGGAVTDLTAADFTVKEGGKDRDIVTTEPATARMQVSVLVEERLIGDGSIRMGIFEFMKRLHGAADIGLITVGIRNQTHVEHTGDLNTLAAALNKLSLNPGPQSNLTEGVLAVAQAIEQKKAPRPVIVAIALSGGQAGGPAANTVLTQLRQSGAIMHAVTLAGGGESAEGVGSLADSSGREQVLGDGSRQAGGRRHDVQAPSAVQRALQQVADDLLAQYAITYMLPDGVKPDRRLNVGVRRRGVVLRAPSAIPDR
jgi:hypothetical protein